MSFKFIKFHPQINHQHSRTRRRARPARCHRLPRAGHTAPSRVLHTLVALLLSFASCNFHLAGRPAYALAASCDDVKFVFARGSGEPLEGPSMTAWRAEIAAALDRTQPKVTYSFYELGSQPQQGNQYPAVSVSDGFDGYLNLVGAYFGSGEIFQFGRSVDEGMAELQAYIKSIGRSCPNTKFVLGGYSQGAMVMSGSLGSLDSSKIIYVSTFGDPKLYLPEGQSTILGVMPKIPDACSGRNLSPYRISVADCYAYEGILGSYRPYQPSDYLGKLGTWCNASDIMCSSGLSISDHTAYVSSNLYRDAAAVITQKVAAAFAGTSSRQTPRPAIHDVAFLIDTTSSMKPYINQYRAEASRLASLVKADGGNIALIEYRDLEDPFEPHELCDFTCDLETFNHELEQLRTHLGGDLDESALSAMLYALNHLNWHPGATKSIVLLTDAGYHDPDHDGTTFAQVLQRSLEIDPVNVFVVAPDTPAAAGPLRQLADSTSGEVFLLGLVNLADITTAIFERPVAHLSLAAYAGRVGDELTFDASISYAVDGGELHFDWDLDGDGAFESQNAGPIVRRTYRSATSHFVQVRVTDSHGYFSTMSASVKITATSGRPATISELNATRQPDDTIAINFQTDAARVLLVTGDLIRGFVEVQAGAGAFVLGELPDDLTATLIPYSADGIRGLSRSVHVAAGEITIDPFEPLLEGPASENQDASSAPSDIPSQAPTGPKRTPSGPAPSDPTFVPKAPNTGYISREYR